MKSVMRFWRFIVRKWANARAVTRLLIGAFVIGLIGLMGLTPNVVFGQTLAWPYAAMIAAAGWGRSGLAFGPMIALIVFGIAQDVTSGAPIGCFALVNIAVFGASAGLSQTFDIERSPGMAIAVPLAAMLIGFVLVWTIASLTGGYIARFMPLFGALFTTLILHFAVSGLFDLGVRRGQTRGATV